MFGKLYSNQLTFKGSPYGLTMTPMGMATSFCNALVLGMRSVVMRRTERSELNSSSDEVDASYAG